MKNRLVNLDRHRPFKVSFLVGLPSAQFESKETTSIAIEAMNWDYEDLSANEFLHKTIERAKRMEALKTLLSYY